MNIQELQTRQLLELFTDLHTELERRNVVRTANLVGDYAEYIVTEALSLTLMPPSTPHYDAKNAEGTRYQVKGRKLTNRNQSRELGAVGDLEHQHFDWLVGVLFNANFSIFRACLIPHVTVSQLTVYKKSGNRNILMLRDSVWNAKGVLDITEALLSTQANR